MTEVLGLWPRTRERTRPEVVVICHCGIILFLCCGAGGLPPIPLASCALFLQQCYFDVLSMLPCRPFCALCPHRCFLVFYPHCTAGLSAHSTRNNAILMSSPCCPAGLSAHSTGNKVILMSSPCRPLCALLPQQCCFDVISTLPCRPFCTLRPHRCYFDVLSTLPCRPQNVRAR